MNSTLSQGQATTSMSRQRRRSETIALEHLKKSIDLPARERRQAQARIRSAKRPLLEAKRLVEWHQKRSVEAEIDGTPDLSDVAELRVHLIRRDGLVDTQGLLHRLEVLVANGCTKDEYKSLAGHIWKHAGVVWKTSKGHIREEERRAEKQLRRALRGLEESQ